MQQDALPHRHRWCHFRCALRVMNMTFATPEATTVAHACSGSVPANWSCLSIRLGSVTSCIMMALDSRVVVRLIAAVRRPTAGWVFGTFAHGKGAPQEGEKAKRESTLLIITRCQAQITSSPPLPCVKFSTRVQKIKSDVEL